MNIREQRFSHDTVINLYAPDEYAWSEIVDQLKADVYYLPSYVRLAAMQEHGKPILFVCRSRGNIWLLPLIVRAIPERITEGLILYDAISPYGYSGPLAFVEDGDDWIDWNEWATKLFIQTLIHNDIITAFVRLHPLYQTQIDVLRRHGDLHGPTSTVVIDLDYDDERIWNNTRSSHRTDIRNLEKKGFVTRQDVDLGRLDVFKDIYKETMHRIGASENYVFNELYYEHIRKDMADVFRLFFVEYDSQFVCGGLFAETNGIVHYHLSGTRTAYLRAAPTKLMLDHVRRWSKMRGNTKFHLGGGRGGENDTLLRFKQGFSRTYMDFYTWRVIADVGAYKNLNENSARTNRQIAFDIPKNYFPAYRALS